MLRLKNEHATKVGLVRPDMVDFRDNPLYVNVGLSARRFPAFSWTDLFTE